MARLGFKNLPAFKKRMHDRLIDNPEENLKKSMGRAVTIVRSHVVESISRGPKTGHTYTKYNPKRTHTASAAGQPPASDTGTLVSGITIDVDVERGAVVGRIMAYASDGGGGNYAEHLEFGTTQMAARPFMQPALDKNAEKIERIIIKEGLID